jgi:DNA-binding response OmpR family regulator
MRVLLIEDEPRILRFVGTALEAEGIDVEGVTDGTRGLERALAEAYDLIVLDLLLPGLGGFTLLERLKQVKPDAPVLILSARSELPAKLRGFDLGAVDYLTKPFALEELLARVRVQLWRSSGNDDTTLSAGALELDLVRRQARLPGGVVELSDREFGLLHHLMRADGRVVSREQLLAEVWGIDFDPKTNVVEVCVRRLRRKLGPGAPIVTVRGAGYCISPD